jgi:hypothetical protein
MTTENGATIGSGHNTAHTYNKEETRKVCLRQDAMCGEQVILFQDSRLKRLMSTLKNVEFN